MSRSRKIGVFCLAACAAAFAASAMADDREEAPDERAARELLGGDLAALQGSWEFRQRQADGEFRIVKQIVGARESFRVYRGTELIAEHSADVDVAKEGPVKVFRWKNGKRLFGPGAGSDIPAGGSVYRLQGDTWVFHFGALDGDPEPPRVMTYRRIPPGESEAPAP